MNKFRIVSIALWLAGALLALSVFDGDIDIPDDWFSSISSLLSGTLCGWLIRLAEKKWPFRDDKIFTSYTNLLIQYGGISGIVAAASLLAFSQFSLDFSLIVFLCGVFLSLAILFPETEDGYG